MRIFLQQDKLQLNNPVCRLLTHILLVHMEITLPRSHQALELPHPHLDRRQRMAKIRGPLLQVSARPTMRLLTMHVWCNHLHIASLK
jgi:hypothetical protein